MAAEASPESTGFHPGESPDGVSTEKAWKSYNLLSLDGGGIRGYWSLLMLLKLMGSIATEEERIAREESLRKEEEGGEIIEEHDGKEVHHSFWPQALPENVSQVPRSWELKRRMEEANDSEARRRAIPAAQRYLPCHYFDFICGSSTGALIAIMLGRFRMTVPDCMLEYESLAAEVFGRPRFFRALRFGVVDRTKYEAAKLKKVFEEVTERRREQTIQGQRRIAFPSKRGLCKTFVTSSIIQSAQPALQNLYLIRSFDHVERTSADRFQRIGSGLSGLSGPSLPRRATGTTMVSHRSDTGLSNTTGAQNAPRKPRVRDKINYGPADDFEIWEVARAATAAPFYFDPLKIDIPSSKEYMTFTDAGFGDKNNPTKEGTDEIEWMHGTESIGIVVSVGTARRDEGSLRRGAFAFKSKLEEIAQKATDTERVHTDMEAKSVTEGFPYYRLNDPNGLKMQLDEWEPKPSRFNNRASGSKTLERIRIAFEHWLASDENRNLIQACAQDLVRCRRARSTTNRAKWERYATGAEYPCRIKGCESENFDNSVQFRQHLARDHRVNREDHFKKELKECRRNWRYQPAPQSI